ncbi:NUDIX hydrolase domain-like protein [Morchella snyderi]|nr:NUDIX hydrolase domain-like protein [Morchella snyderi]
MTTLSPASVQAIANLRNYAAPLTNIYSALPLTRRAAVLLLLFADRRGDLRVVLTVRSAKLKSFAGHVAFPGGKADAGETPFHTARREAFEEIGLPLDSRAFTVEHLTELPHSLAVTNLGVRPCVAFLHWDRRSTVEEALVPHVDEKEVAKVFTVPLERFLGVRYGVDPARGVDPEVTDGVGWYQGSWLPWNGTRWKLHEFQAPVWDAATLTRYRVWGLTARILVDAARIAYGRDPEFSFVQQVGDEDMIRELLEEGELSKPKEKAESSMIYDKSERKSKEKL